MSRSATNRIPPRTLLILLVLPAFIFPAAAQGQQETDRLFLGFAEDAVLADDQWWEVQVEIAEQDFVDLTLARLVFAVQPYSKIEIGGRIGFGSTDTPPSLPEGSGATDLELWGKYDLGRNKNDTRFAAGALAIVPTGDDTAGLGSDSFSAGIFGSLRHDFPKAVMSAYIGARFNQDGRILGADIEAKASALLGVGVLVPMSDTVCLVGEGKIESSRFEGGDSDFRILGGVNWRPNDRGTVRAGLAFGVTDGAPDTQLLAGYAFRF